jgi:hypothetical protein
VLQVPLSFVQDKTYDGGRYESETYRKHENDEDPVSSYLFVFHLLGNRERRSDDLELEIGVASGFLKESFVHELRIKGSDILGGYIYESSNLELLGQIVSLIDVVGSIVIRLERLIIPSIKNVLIKLLQESILSIDGCIEVRIAFVSYFKGFIIIRKCLNNITWLNIIDGTT